MVILNTHVFFVCNKLQLKNKWFSSPRRNIKVTVEYLMYMEYRKMDIISIINGGNVQTDQTKDSLITQNIQTRIHINCI